MISKVKLILEARYPRWSREIFALFLVFCIGFCLLMYKSKFSLKKKIVSTVLYLYSYNLLVITLLMRDTKSCFSYNFLPFFLDRFDIQNKGVWDCVFNALLFLPLGFFIVCLSENKHKYRNTMFFGFCITLLIEVLQLITKLGEFELDDVVFNTLGTAVGVGLYPIIKKLLKKLKEKGWNQ